MLYSIATLRPWLIIGLFAVYPLYAQNTPAQKHEQSIKETPAPVVAPQIQLASTPQQGGAQPQQPQTLGERFVDALVSQWPLVAIGIATLVVIGWQAREMARATQVMRDSTIEVGKQTAAIQRQADAMINAERAWIEISLIPICKRFGQQWHRPIGDGWVALDQHEILNGLYLRHKLKLTNMGRTPARMATFKIGRSYPTGKDVAELPDGCVLPAMQLLESYHVLAGGESVSTMEIDISSLVKTLIKQVGDSKKYVIFYGYVEYRHIFSEDHIEKSSFRYLYVPSSRELERIPVPTSEQTGHEWYEHSDQQVVP